MKKLFLSTLLMVLPLLASAYDCQVDGIYYNLIPKGNVAEVTYQKTNSYGEIISDYSGSVVIPEKFTYEGVEYSVTTIGERAFSICRGLTSVTIPNSVTSIGGGAFSNCSGLTSVHITDLAAWCKISFNDSFSNPLYYAHHLYLKGEEIKDLVIPNSVTSIGNYAFESCTGLTSVTIPNSVTTIGDGAFGSCSGLSSVTIPNSVTTIGGSAFYSCRGLTSVTIPNSVTTIEIAAFSDCTGLTSVTIPNSVTTIGSQAFTGCRGLTSVPLPNSVTTIGDGAFWNCSGLTSVTIPNSVTSIGGSAFNGCSGLTSVTIGNSVTSIGSGTFLGCKNIETINSRISKLFEIKENVFESETYINAKLKIPVGMAYKYQNTAAWNKFLVIEESDPTDITQVSSEDLLISAQNGTITVRGEQNGLPLAVYSADGKMLGAATMKDGQASISTNLQRGEIAIVKVGSKSVKLKM